MLDAEQLYKEYINDVIKRCIKAITLEENLKDELMSRPIDELKEMAKSIIVANNKYRKLKKTTPNILNSVSLFEKELKARAYRSMFWDTKEIKALYQYNIDKNREIDDDETISFDERKYKKQVINHYCILKTEALFNQLDPKTQEKCLKIYYAKMIAINQADEVVRREVKEIVSTPINTTLDNGNCTKAIIASLLKLEKKYNIKILKNIKDEDVENILHPKQLIEALKPYVKTSISGYIKDIEDIKIGDIFFISWNENPPHHAMMCYDFDEENRAKVLGFSNNTKDFDGFYKTDGTTPLRGIIIDVKSLLIDTCKRKSKINSPITNNERE